MNTHEHAWILSAHTNAHRKSYRINSKLLFSNEWGNPPPSRIYTIHLLNYTLTIYWLTNPSFPFLLDAGVPSNWTLDLEQVFEAIRKHVGRQLLTRSSSLPWPKLDVIHPSNPLGLYQGVDIVWQSTVCSTSYIRKSLLGQQTLQRGNYWQSLAVTQSLPQRTFVSRLPSLQLHVYFFLYGLNWSKGKLIRNKELWKGWEVFCQLRKSHYRKQNEGSSWF